MTRATPGPCTKGPRGRALCFQACSCGSRYVLSDADGSRTSARERGIPASRYSSMKRPASLTCTFLALLGLPAAYLSQSSSREAALGSVLETSPMVAAWEPQVPSAARAWADPPVRQEHPPAATKAAVVKTDSALPGPAATGILHRPPDVEVLPYALASPQRVHSPRLRAALFRKPNGLSRRVEVSRRKRLHDQHRAVSQIAAAQSEPAPTPVEAEPIEFSLASR